MAYRQRYGYGIEEKCSRLYDILEACSNGVGGTGVFMLMVIHPQQADKKNAGTLIAKVTCAKCCQLCWLRYFERRWLEPTKSEKKGILMETEWLTTYKQQISFDFVIFELLKYLYSLPVVVVFFYN